MPIYRIPSLRFMKKNKKPFKDGFFIILKCVMISRNLMYLFLHGEDTYRSRQKLEEIVESYKKSNKSGLGLYFLDGESADFHNFMQELQTVSMFQEKKLIVLKNVFENPEFKNAFLAQAPKLADQPHIIIFYEESQIASNDSLFKFLAENAKVQEFEHLAGQKLRNWAKREFQKYGTDIDSLALETMAACVGSDLWRFSNEIKKISAFKKDKKVEIEDVRLLVRPKIEADIFKTIGSLASKNKKQALSSMRRHLEKGDSPLYLLAMINYQFRSLLTRRNSYYFSPAEIKEIYGKLLETDLKIKTGQLDPQTALDLLIAEI